MRQSALQVVAGNDFQKAVNVKPKTGYAPSDLPEDVAIAKLIATENNIPRAYAERVVWEQKHGDDKSVTFWIKAGERTTRTMANSLGDTGLDAGFGRDDDEALSHGYTDFNMNG